MNELNWYFKLKNGIKIIEPSDNLSDSYLKESKLSLSRAEKLFNEKDFLWATVIIYYAEYSALYSFLQKIGVKCENHTCSILLTEKILGEKINLIESHMEKRVDAQYYMRLGKDKEIEKILADSKEFIIYFDNLISNISKKDLLEFRIKVNNLKQKGIC